MNKIIIGALLAIGAMAAATAIVVCKCKDRDAEPEDCDFDDDNEDVEEGSADDVVIEKTDNSASDAVGEPSVEKSDEYDLEYVDSLIDGEAVESDTTEAESTEKSKKRSRKKAD